MKIPRPIFFALLVFHSFFRHFIFQVNLKNSFFIILRAFYLQLSYKKKKKNSQQLFVQVSRVS